VYPGAIATNMIKNTIDRADNQKRTQKNLEMLEKIALSVKQAVNVIFNGVKRKQTRIRVGKDSVMLDLAKRMMPVVT
jgi:short-subunit dehydrogenase